MSAGPHEAADVDLLGLAGSLVDRARPGEHIEVVVSHERSTEVRAFDGDVESFVSSDSSGVGIRVVRDDRQGFAWAGTLDPSVLGETLDEARDNVAFAGRDPHLVLARPDGVAPPALDLFDPAMGAVDPVRKIDLVLELERAVLGRDVRICGLESAEYADVVSATAVASTTGVRALDVESHCSLMAYTLAGGDTETTTGFGWSMARGFDGLDVEVAAAAAVDRAVAMLGARRTPTRRCAIVLDPWVSAQLVAVVAESFSGTEVVRGRSWLAERVGERVAPDFVTLTDRPDEARWFGASRHDAEGLASRSTPLISAGVVQQFVHDSYSAACLGVSSTGSAVRAGYRTTPVAGVRAAVLEPGSATPAEMVAGVDDGVFITELQGLHSGVNPISGDFSTGIEGRVIRHGELAEPVREVTIASTLPKMLGAIASVGNDLTVVPVEAAGVTLRVDDVTVSGT